MKKPLEQTGKRRPKPLFITGSKRSGSSLFVNLLNTHDQIFITHESDIVWILYQLYSGCNGSLQPYPFDEARGMQVTLDVCGELLSRHAAVTENMTGIVETFSAVLDHIRRKGRIHWDDPKPTGQVRWIGDKKPVQHCDPDIRKFMRDAFPTATYFHLIRHPRAVVGSMMNAARTWGDESVPIYWRGSASEVLLRWVIHEEWVLDMKEESPNAVYSVRLEDLAADPVETMDKVFGILDLETPPDMKADLRKWVRKRPNKNYVSFKLPDSAEADRIMEIYRYSRD